MNKNASYIILFAIIALAALALMFYTSDLYGKAGYIGTMIFTGRVDDSNGKPIWGGSITAVAGHRTVARGTIKGSYMLHFPTTFEKDMNWYKDKPVSIYVSGKLCTTFDLYKFAHEKGGGVIAKANLNFKCGFALTKGKYG
jgi:hypothetical protein